MDFSATEWSRGTGLGGMHGQRELLFLRRGHKVGHNVRERALYIHGVRGGRLLLDDYTTP